MTTDQPLMIVIDSGLKSAILCAGGLLVAGLMMRHSSAARRHVIYTGTLIACLLLPVLSQMLPHWRVLPQWPTPVAQVVPPAPTAMTVAPPAAAPEPPPLPPAIETPLQPAPVTIVLPASTPQPIQPAGYTQFTLIQWLTLAWLAGAILFLCPVLLGQLAIFRIRYSAQPIYGAFTSRRCRMPMACGLLHPIIILPEDAHTWAAARRDAVIRHEAEHLRRRDCLWQQLGQFARALYWFNPLIWLTYRRMLCEAERACDDAVLTEGSKPSDYAEHLLSIATTGRSDLLLASAGVAMARTTSLEGRLLSILDVARSRRAVTQGLVCLCAVVVLAVAAPLAMLRAQSPAQPAPATQPVTTRPAADPVSFAPDLVEMQLEKAQAVAQAKALEKEADLKRKEGEVAEAAIAEKQREAAEAEVALWTTRIEQAATRPANAPVRVIIGSADLLLINGKPGHWTDLQDLLSHLQGPAAYYLERAVADSKMPLDAFQHADERLRAMVRQYGLKYFSDTGNASEHEIAAYKKAAADRLATTTSAAPTMLQAAPVEPPASRPAATSGRLDFRIAPTLRAPDDLRISSQRMGELIRQLAKGGPQEVTKASPDLVWIEIDTADPSLITADYQNKHYALFSNSPKHTMLYDGTWGLDQAYITTSELGQPAVGFRFDDAGAAKFKDLTASHLKQALACVLDGKVVSVATIQSVISRSGIISAQAMTMDQAQQIIRDLNAGIVPHHAATSPATAPVSDIQQRVQQWVKDFLLTQSHVTSIEVMEFGKPETLDDGATQIRCRVVGEIRGQDRFDQDAIYKFTAEGRLVDLRVLKPKGGPPTGITLTLEKTTGPRKYPVIAVQPGADPVFNWQLPADPVDYMGFFVTPVPTSDIANMPQQQLWKALNDINQMAWCVLGFPAGGQKVTARLIQYGIAPKSDGPTITTPARELREGFYLVALCGYQGRYIPQEGRQPFTSATCVLKVGNPKEPPKPDYSKLTPEQMQAKVQEWVEDFFSSNYRDITARKLIEWGKAQKLDNGNWQIRYKYEATIWNKDKVIHDKLFTFTPEGGFVSVADASPSQPAPKAQPAQPAKPITPADRTKADELAKEGWNLWQKQQFAPAADRFSEAVKLNPNATNAWNGLGWALFNSGRSDEAHAAFAKCIALAPNHPAALNGLGQIELQQGDLAQSEKHLLAAAPTSSAAWWGLAKLYLVQEKYADAAKWADRILKDDPSNAEAQQLKTAAQEKRLPDALRELKAKDQEQGKTSSVQPAAPAANTADAGLPPLARRDVNRPLSDFPQKVDLSTPESAWAAWQRASSRMDAQAVVDLSWVEIPLQDEKAFWERELARNPENVKIFTQALANSKLLEVFLDRDELATTITHLAYPEGKGRDPYSIRVFGKIAGQWKNLGEDRSPTLEEARTLPQIKRSGYWNQFQDLKAVWEKRLSNTMATASSTTAFEHVIPFELGKTSFLEGDRIVIKEIRGAAPTITPGNTYLITGTYTLSSRERATIGAFTTAADPHEGKGPIAKAQMVSVNKGDGTFTLTMPITIKGQTHLSFYPAEGGGSFGEVYFNTP